MDLGLIELGRVSNDEIENGQEVIEASDDKLSVGPLQNKNQLECG